MRCKFDAFLMQWQNLHLGIKDTGVLFDDTNGLIKSHDCKRRAFAVSEHSRQIKSQVLRLKFGSKAVADAVALSGWDLDIVPRRGQITNDLRSRSEGGVPETTSNEGDTDGFRLLIGKGQKSLGWVSVDQFDAEDFGGGKGCRDLHFQVCRSRGSLDFFVCLKQRTVSMFPPSWPVAREAHILC